MKITAPIFANRLRKMLDCEDVCERCPAELGFHDSASRVDVFSNKISNGRWLYTIRSRACEICQKFVSADKFNCPCRVLGHDEAIAAAHKALELWDAGQHPMQEEGGNDLLIL